MRTRKKANSNVAVIKTNNGILNIVLDKGTFTVNTDHPNYQKILDCVEKRQFKSIDKLVNVAKAITKFTFGKIKVVNGSVKFGEHTLQSSLIDRIINDMRAGNKGFKKYIKLLSWLMQNPSERAVQHLYGFIASHCIEIDNNGMIIGWKAVGMDWKDLYAHKVISRVGKATRMPRNMISEDYNIACSNGLHIGTQAYAKQYGSQSGNYRLLKVQINPKDVVCIPMAHADQGKIRCCEYKTLQEVKNK